MTLLAQARLQRVLSNPTVDRGWPGPYHNGVILKPPALPKRALVACACKFSLENQFVGLPEHLRPRFLSGLQEAELTTILSNARHRRFRASSVIINQEDSAERFYLLTSGRGR